MDEWNFATLLKFLSTSQTELPCLDTWTLQKDQLEMWITTDRKGRVNNKALPRHDLQTTVKNIIHEHQNSQPSQGTQTQLYFAINTHWARRLFNPQQFVKFIKRQSNINAIHFIEIIDVPHGEQINFYTVWLRYGDGVYTSQYFRQTQFLDRTPYEGRIRHKILDIAKVIMSEIESTEEKRVIQLELEFMRLRHDKLVLSNCKKLIMAAPKIASALKQDTDLQLLHAQHTAYNPASMSTARSLAPRTTQVLYEQPSEHISKQNKTTNETEVVLVNGQIRNWKSRGNSPIKILSPLDSFIEPAQQQNTPTNEESAENEKLEEEQFQNELKEKHRSSFNKARMERSMSVIETFHKKTKSFTVDFNRATSFGTYKRKTTLPRLSTDFSIKSYEDGQTSNIDNNSVFSENFKEMLQRDFNKESTAAAVERRLNKLKLAKKQPKSSIALAFNLNRAKGRKSTLERMNTMLSQRQPDLKIKLSSSKAMFSIDEMLANKNKTTPAKAQLNFKDMNSLVIPHRLMPSQTEAKLIGGRNSPTEDASLTYRESNSGITVSKIRRIPKINSEEKMINALQRRCDTILQKYGRDRITPNFLSTSEPIFNAPTSPKSQTSRKSPYKARVIKNIKKRKPVVYKA